MGDERETAILQAALHVFAEEGFSRATMDDIAQNAKVAKGTLFYRYNSKEELFVRVIQWATDSLIERVEQATKDLTGAVDRLKTAIELQTKLSFEYPEFAKLLLSEVWGKQERQHLFRISLKRYLVILESFITEGMAGGEMRTVEPELLSAAIIGMTAAASLRILLANQDITPEATVSEIQMYLLKGIQS